MAAEDEIKRALTGEHKKKGKTHTHGVHYERAANGGYIAHVHKHHGAAHKSEGFSHTEEHALPGAEDAQAHFDEHMGDQPDVGAEMGEDGAPNGAQPEAQEQEAAPEMA